MTPNPVEPYNDASKIVEQRKRAPDLKKPYIQERRGKSKKKKAAAEELPEPEEEVVEYQEEEQLYDPGEAPGAPMYQEQPPPGYYPPPQYQQPPPQYQEPPPQYQQDEPVYDISQQVADLGVLVVTLKQYLVTMRQYLLFQKNLLEQERERASARAPTRGREDYDEEDDEYEEEERRPVREREPPQKGPRPFVPKIKTLADDPDLQKKMKRKMSIMKLGAGVMFILGGFYVGYDIASLPPIDMIVMAIIGMGGALIAMAVLK